MNQMSQNITKFRLSVELLFAVYCSVLFTFAIESRPPYAWSVRPSYFHFWHPHGYSLDLSGLAVFYAELFLIPAVAIFLALKAVSAVTSARKTLRAICGIAAIAAFPITCVYVGGHLIVGISELAIAACCVGLWACRKWPVSDSTSVFMLSIHFAFWFLFCVDASGLVNRPLTRWSVWDCVVIAFPLLGFSYSLMWAAYFRLAEA